MPPSSPTKKKKRRPINVSNDIWWNVFEWVLRAELGLNMALVSSRFDSVVAKFLAHKCWSIGNLKTQPTENRADGEIVRYDDDGNIIGNFSIAETPRPNGIKQFKSIFLSYFDNNVLEFLRNLRPLFLKNGINLVLNVGNFTCGRSPKWWPITAQQVWPLMAENVVRLAILDDYGFSSELNRLSADFLCQCPNLRLVDSREVFLEVPPTCGVSSSAHALWQWLHSPRADGCPKVLLCQEVWPFFDRVIELKMAFSNASSPVSFIIRLFLYSLEGAAFELRNDRTGELLTMEMIAEGEEEDENNRREGQPQNGGGEFDDEEEEEEQQMYAENDDDLLTHYIEPKRYLWLLKRRPIEGGPSPKQWAQWEREAIGWEWAKACNVIRVENEEEDLTTASTGGNDEEKREEGMD